MSHELRTPLNVILGFTQIMNRSKNLPQEHLEHLETISRSGEHLLTLINQVLDLSKIEAGKTIVNENNFDLYRLLGYVEDMFRPKADDKHLQLCFEREPGVPQYVQTDEVKLRQVLINLLNNALKFTEVGGIFASTWITVNCCLKWKTRVPALPRMSWTDFLRPLCKLKAGNRYRKVRV